MQTVRLLMCISNTKGLNVISPTWFYLNDNDGNLMNLASADYVDYCHSQGVEVWALVSNLENEEVGYDRSFNTYFKTYQCCQSVDRSSHS